MRLSFLHSWHLSLLLGLLLQATQAFAWKPLFIGHRGCDTGVMNTAEAFRNGVLLYGYDGLECDLRVTSDGNFVISHDETTNAVGGNLRVESSTLAQLRAEVYTQTRHGVTYTGGICTFDEYLQICEDYSVIPVIELKYTTGINSGNMSNFPGVYEALVSHHLDSTAVILTSMLQSLIYVREHYPSLHCQYLLASLTDAAFDKCVQYGIEPSVEFPKVTYCDTRRCHDAGLSMASYTVNWTEWLDKIAPMGVRMVTTDNLRAEQLAEQDSMEWSEICIPPGDTIPVYVSEKFVFSQSEGNLPLGFPSASQRGKQGCYLDGVFYANGPADASVYAFDTLGNALSVSLPSSLQGGIFRDDAGHLILDDSPSSASPSRLLIYRSLLSAPDTIVFSLPESGQTNYPTASGDIYSPDGGYVYFYPKGRAFVSMLHIAEGRLIEVLTSSPLTAAGATVSLVLPSTDPSTFLYLVPGNGYYRYSRKDRGEYFHDSPKSEAPGRNRSTGGAAFDLDGHAMLIHPSGIDYSGGWTLRDMSAGGHVIFSQSALGNYESNRQSVVANPGYGVFFTVERIDEHTVDVYEYCMGCGLGAWRISTMMPLPAALPRSSADSPRKFIRDGRLYIRHADYTFDIMGRPAY